MKKVIMFFLCLMLLAIAAIASANYPTYLNGDRNYILVDGHMGAAWYVDRSSLKVQKCAPPEYIINVNVVTARSAIDDERDFYEGGQGVIVSIMEYRFFYDWDTRRMYQDFNGKRDYLDPWGSWAETGIRMPAGEMSFYLANKLKFYGDMEKYSKYSKYTNSYYGPFSDDFYMAAN